MYSDKSTPTTTGAATAEILAERKEMEEMPLHSFFERLAEMSPAERTILVKGMKEGEYSDRLRMVNSTKALGSETITKVRHRLGLTLDRIDGETQDGDFTCASMNKPDGCRPKGHSEHCPTILWLKKMASGVSDKWNDLSKLAVSEAEQSRYSLISNASRPDDLDDQMARLTADRMAPREWQAVLQGRESDLHSFLNVWPFRSQRDLKRALDFAAQSDGIDDDDLRVSAMSIKYRHDVSSSRERHQTALSAVDDLADKETSKKHAKEDTLSDEDLGQHFRFTRAKLLVTLNCDTCFDCHSENQVAKGVAQGHHR